MYCELEESLNSEARTKATEKHEQYAHLIHITYLKFEINLKNHAPNPAIMPANNPHKFYKNSNPIISDMLLS